jgi:2-succinyl-6-hydroxy-2,4-cyclohexadiene-1-carboxylate synthase/2-amino-4-hydroxy-6-hydroxymethyldihydropteridine diphosphokinase
MTRLLALHGFTGAGADFDTLRSHLPAAWRWHCPDLPGHGVNRLEPGSGVFTLEQHLDFLSGQLLPDNTNVNAKTNPSPNPNSAGPLAVGVNAPNHHGYSMGGRLALHLATRNPAAFAGLVLIGASPGLADPSAREQRRLADESLAHQIETSGLPSFFAAWWQSPLFAGLREPRHDVLRARRLRENTPAGLAASLRGIGAGALPSLWDSLPSLRFPVLCIAGELDAKFSVLARDIAARLPDAQAVLIPGAHHLPHIEQPEAVAPHLAAFAARRQVLLALGSNLGDRAAHIAAAVEALRALPGTQVLAVSGVRETKPVGYAAQPDFLNAACAISTTLTPEELLDACLRIEAGRGRLRTVPNGPRTLDLDLLFYAGEVRATSRLVLPHPRWAERSFVCEPLAEILRTPPLMAACVWDGLRACL